MSLKYTLLATEGAHDQAAVCSLLRLFGMKKFSGESNFLGQDQFEFWKRLLPTPSNNLYKRIDMMLPRIFTSDTHSVAVYQGAGSALLQNLIDIIDNHDPYRLDLHSFGIIVDADTNQPEYVAKRYADKLKIYFPKISIHPAAVMAGPPRCGIYVLPDNKRHGTLDSLLVDCADYVYPDHKAGAEVFLDSLDLLHKSHWKPFDHDKALVATIVSVIQPGIANTLSIARDRWICDQTVRDVAVVGALHQFIGNLLELPLNQSAKEVETPS